MEKRKEKEIEIEAQQHCVNQNNINLLENAEKIDIKEVAKLTGLGEFQLRGILQQVLSGEAR